MFRTLTLIAVALGVLALASSDSSVQAQPRPRLLPTPPPPPPRPKGTVPSVAQQSNANLARAAVNPNYYLPNGMTVSQYAYNVRTLGNAYASIPPWLYGYNPYPQVVNYGPSYSVPTIPYYSPYSIGYNPYAYGIGGAGTYYGASPYRLTTGW